MVVPSTTWWVHTIIFVFLCMFNLVDSLDDRFLNICSDDIVNLFSSLLAVSVMHQYRSTMHLTITTGIECFHVLVAVRHRDNVCPLAFRVRGLRN